jgi:hypothetical protein
LISARSIALRGIGYGALALSLHGLVNIPDKVNLQPPIGGGGTTTRSDAYEDLVLKQIHQEDEIIILAVAQLIVHGAFT